MKLPFIFENLSNSQEYVREYIQWNINAMKINSEKRDMKIQPEYLIFKNLVDTGSFYTPMKLTIPERKIYDSALNKAGFRPKYKHCYINAQLIALSDSTGMLKYCEGYANYVIPTSHAWLTINDKVIDPTWKYGESDKKQILGLFPDEYAYFGINFSNDIISLNQSITGSGCSIVFSELNYKNISNKKPNKPIHIF